MSKDDAFDLIVKAFGVGLLVAAIVAIPQMVEGVILLRTLDRLLPMGDGQELSSYWSLAESTHLASSLGAVVKCVVYALASFNFLRSGSWVRRLMGRPLERATAAAAADEAPAERPDRP